MPILYGPPPAFFCYASAPVKHLLLLADTCYVQTTRCGDKPRAIVYLAIRIEAGKHTASDSGVARMPHKSCLQAKAAEFINMTFEQ